MQLDRIWIESGFASGFAVGLHLDLHLDGLRLRLHSHLDLDVYLGCIFVWELLGFNIMYLFENDLGSPRSVALFESSSLRVFEFPNPTFSFLLRGQV